MSVITTYFAKLLIIHEFLCTAVAGDFSINCFKEKIWRRKTGYWFKIWTAKFPASCLLCTLYRSRFWSHGNFLLLSSFFHSVWYWDDKWRSYCLLTSSILSRTLLTWIEFDFEFFVLFRKSKWDVVPRNVISYWVLG